MAPYPKNIPQAMQKYVSKNLTRFLGISAVALLLLPSLLFPVNAVAQEVRRDSASVIMYHRFGEDRYPSTNIRLAQFEEHLQLLTNGDYTVLPLPEIIETLRAGGTVPDRTVAITIDDAYLSVYEQAWPRLKELGLPFTIFVATEPVEKNRRGYMSWDMLRELQSQGVTIGSQTHTLRYTNANYRAFEMKVRFSDGPISEKYTPGYAKICKQKFDPIFGYQRSCVTAFAISPLSSKCCRTRGKAR